MDEATHKKPAALDRFMDKVRYAPWSGMPAVAILLDTTTDQDIRGESC